MTKQILKGARSAKWLALSSGRLLLLAVLGFTYAPIFAQDVRGAAAKAGKAGITTADQRANQVDLEALIVAARKEGSLLFYSTPAEEVTRRVATAFEKQYSVKAVFVRLLMAQFVQRYSSEAAAGSFPADLALPSNSTATTFANDAIAQGWGQSLSAANLPIVREGSFPTAFYRNQTAVVQVTPWGIAYHSGNLTDATVPKTWQDVLSPKFKDQILIPAPTSSVAYVEFWNLLLTELGPQFLERFREQRPRAFGGAIPAMQSLAAGEGLIVFPSQGNLVQALAVKGAPVKFSPQEVTTGNEVHLYLTAPSKSAHPSAARLFANWIMSREGNAVLNSDPGAVSVYDTTALSSKYKAPDPKASERKSTIYPLLGFKE